MIHALRRIRVLLVVYFADMMQYRGELFFWMVATALPLIMMGIWVPAANHAEAAGGTLGMSGQTMARYFLALFIVRQFSICWIVYHFEWHVVTGRLSPLLLQPLHPTYRFFFAHLSEQWARLPLVVIMLVGVLLLYPDALGAHVVNGEQRLWLPSLANVARAVGLIYAAFILRYLLQSIWSMLSFWIERASRVENLFLLPYTYLSGLFAPLEAFDEPVRNVVLWTPFPYMLWFPANILIGRADQLPITIGEGLAMMTGWAAIFFVAQYILWRLGLKQFSAMGA